MSDTDTTRIVKILEVKDTREYEEHGDRWVPIPGSGDARECSRCGRLHEVHATVLLSTGGTLVVGTGCASQTTAELAPQFKKAASAAKTLQKLRAELAYLEALAAEYQRVYAEVEALPLGCVKTTRPASYPWPNDPGYDVHVGDVWVCGHGDGKYAWESALQSAVYGWRRSCRRDRGMTSAHEQAAQDADDLRARVVKTETKLATLMDGGAL